LPRKAPSRCLFAGARAPPGDEAVPAINRSGSSEDTKEPSPAELLGPVDASDQLERDPGLDSAADTQATDDFGHVRLALDGPPLSSNADLPGPNAGFSGPNVDLPVSSFDDQAPARATKDNEIIPLILIQPPADDEPPQSGSANHDEVDRGTTDACRRPNDDETRSGEDQQEKGTGEEVCFRQYVRHANPFFLPGWFARVCGSALTASGRARAFRTSGAQAVL